MAVPAEHWDSPKFQSCFTQPGSAAKSSINLHNSECLLLLKPLNREYPGKSISVFPPKRRSVDAPDCSVVFLGAVINPDFPTAAQHPHSSPSEKNHGRNRCRDHNRVFPFLEPGEKIKKVRAGVAVPRKFQQQFCLCLNPLCSGVSSPD